MTQRNLHQPDDEPIVAYAIGHPAYPASSINRYAWALDSRGVYRELLKRGIPIKVIRTALRALQENPGVYLESPTGEVIEIAWERVTPVQYVLQ